jgi:hypothetical protein
VGGSRDYFLLDFLISHLHVLELVVAYIFFFFFFLLGFLRHFLLAVFPIKSLPLTFDGSKKRKFSSLVSSSFPEIYA